MGSLHHIKHLASPNLSIQHTCKQESKRGDGKGEGLGVVHKAHTKNCELILAIIEERKKKESVAKEIFANKQGKSPY